MLGRTLATSLVLLLVFGCGGSGGGGTSGEPDAGGGTEEPVTRCDEPVPAPSDGVCDVTAGSGEAVLLRGDVLAPDTVYEGGSVLIRNDAIECVGCDCSSAEGYEGATQIACAGAAISPGLINPHDHLRFTEGRPIDHGDTRYDHRHDWRGSLSTPYNPHGSGQTDAGMRWGELRMLFSGVTSIIGSGGASGLVRNLDQLLPEEESRGLRENEFTTFSLDDRNEQFHSDCGWNYAYDEKEAAEFPAFLPHVAEGIDDYAAEEFRCQSTSFDGGQDYTEPNATHIHGIGLTAADYMKMVGDKTRLLWSPRSNLSLYGHTAKVGLFDRLGGVIALGTDWTYSGSANMLRELACADSFNADYLDGHFSDRELWLMATRNAAIATDSSHLLGSLEEGMLADVAIFGGDGSHHRLVLEAGNEEVALVLKSGQPLYGEREAVLALDDGCEDLEVCGLSRAVCAGREFAGTTYASIAAEVAGGEAAYAAAFCGGAPAGEPTCVPSRPGEFTGASTADDSDGDGIADASDSCPRVFNPVRPIDGGVQPDADGDGEGDACDETPLLEDLDGDGVENSADNCPFVENPDQMDADTDTRGDACDFCPDVANSDSVCPKAPAVETTIEAIRTGQHSMGAHVTVSDVVVTALWQYGLWVQDPDAGPAHAGIQVYTGSEPQVEIGAVVDATGEITEYHGDSQLEEATVTPKGMSSSIEPAALTVNEAATEDYEGVLVTLTDVDTVVDPWDCSQDDGDCNDQGLWEVNGTIVVYDRAYKDSDWEAQSGATSITGVMMYRFDRRRILPRSAADLGD